MNNPRVEIDCHSLITKQESSRILMLITDANDYKVGVGNISNAYLNTNTKERVCTTAGPELVQSGYVTQVGCKARVIKAQYGLKLSGH